MPCIAAGLSVERDEAKLANFSMLYLITPGGLYKRDTKPKISSRVRAVRF